MAQGWQWGSQIAVKKIKKTSVLQLFIYKSELHSVYYHVSFSLKYNERTQAMKKSWGKNFQIIQKKTLHVATIIKYLNIKS